MFMALCAFMAGCGTKPEPEGQSGTYIIDFQAQEYANQEVVKAYRKDGVTLEFSNAKWYDNAASLRLYSGSTLKVSAAKMVEKVAFSFGEGDPGNEILADNGTYADGVWTGSAGKIVFTVGGESGHRRVTGLEITLGEADAPAEDDDTPSQGGELKAGTDVLTVGWTGVRTGGQYESWTLQGAVSSATYAGNSANYQGQAIQLRSKNEDSGIVSTVSAGNVRTVKVVWNDKTYGERFLEIYGHTMVYTSPGDLYQSGTAGSLLGTLAYPAETELTVEGAYQYIGLRSTDGAVYLDSIEITWE